LPRRRRRPARASLADVQRWFQREIVRPHVATGRAPRSTPDARAASVVLPSATLRPAERIAIYSDMYFTRLLGALSEEYPAVHRLLGPERFERLARAYLRRHPSRHWSLGVLGRRLPRFLAGPVRVPRRALLHDVARLECAQSEVFDEEEAAPLTPAAFQAAPPDLWAGARLRTVPGLRLLAFRHRTNRIVTAARRGEPLPPLGPERTWVAVHRRDHLVWRHDLDAPRFALLSALQAGRPMGAAIRAAARRFPGAARAMEPELVRWFSQWVEEGFFRAVEAQRRPKRTAASSARSSGGKNARKPGSSRNRTTRPRPRDSSTR
jgi:hypothetical protein